MKEKEKETEREREKDMYVTYRRGCKKKREKKDKTASDMRRRCKSGFELTRVMEKGKEQGEA